MTPQKNDQKLTFNQLIKLVADETGMSKQFVHSFTREMVDIIKEGLNRDGKVNLSKLGIFELKQVKEREGRDPKTGEPITIPAHQKVVFKPYKKVRKQINAPYEKLEASFASEEETPSSEKNSHKSPPFLNTTDARKNKEKGGSLIDSGSCKNSKPIIFASGIAAVIIGWSIYKFIIKKDHEDEK